MMKKIILSLAFFFCLLEGYSQAITVNNGVCFFGEEFTLNGTENGKNRYTIGIFEIKWDGSQWVIRSTFGAGILYATCSFDSSPNPPDDATATGAGMPWVPDGSNCPGAVFSVVGSGTQNFLPVELSRFVATSLKPQQVDLEWITASELNNEGFEIQRSLDGKNWTTLTFVYGKGTTEQTQYYSYTDRVATTGIVYYRLKQMDFDGGFEYSETITIKLLEGATFSVFPNPAKGAIQVTGYEEDLVQITNLNGQLLLQQKLINPTIGIASLVPGIYLLKKIDTSGQVQTQKLIVR